MKRLRVVGTSGDQSELILSSKEKGRSGTHSVAIDKRLLNVLQKAVYARRHASENQSGDEKPYRPPVEPKIPPREIQRLLRAGLTPTQVAREAEVDVAYVEQFYPPVLYERVGVIQEALTLRQEKPRLGVSGRPLGEAVVHYLTTRRVRLSDEQMAAAWMATREESQPWTVTFSFPYRGKTRKAAWRFDPRSRSLTATNKMAQEIGWVPNGTNAPAPIFSNGAEEPHPVERRVSPKRRAARGSSAKGGASAKKATRGASTKGATRSAATKRAAMKRAAPGKRAIPKAGGGRASAGRKTAKPKSAAAGARKKPSARSAGPKARAKGGTAARARARPAATSARRRRTPSTSARGSATAGGGRKSAAKRAPARPRRTATRAR